MEEHPEKYNPKQNATDVRRHNWEVMKPFVHFAFKAMVLVGGALIGIVKLLPGLIRHKKSK
jgi:hypothetical protein